MLGERVFRLRNILDSSHPPKCFTLTGRSISFRMVGLIVYYLDGGYSGWSYMGRFKQYTQIPPKIGRIEPSSCDGLSC